MKKDTTYHDFVIYDLMANFPNITSRPMMGGWIIYSDKKPFGLISNGELYLKSKTQKENWIQFQYEKSKNKIVKLCYWKIPEEIIENQYEFENAVESVLKDLNI